MLLKFNDKLKTKLEKEEFKILLTSYFLGFLFMLMGFLFMLMGFLFMLIFSNFNLFFLMYNDNYLHSL